MVAFATLLGGLVELQTTVGTTFGLKGGSAENQADIIDEIRAIATENGNVIGNNIVMPKSILDLIANFSEHHFKVNTSCAKNYATFKNVDGYLRSANVWEALALIFRELANHSDKGAIKLKMLFDECQSRIERRKNGELFEDEVEDPDEDTELPSDDGA